MDYGCCGRERSMEGLVGEWMMVGWRGEIRKTGSLIT